MHVGRQGPPDDRPGLAPGILAGRIADEDGRPRGGLAPMGVGGSDPRSSVDPDIVPGIAIGPGLVIGRDGRFRIVGPILGLDYGADAAEEGVRPGEALREVGVARAMSRTWTTRRSSRPGESSRRETGALAHRVLAGGLRPPIPGSGRLAEPTLLGRRDRLNVRRAT